jgi:Fuc2NAc and GlcNAc transferase
MPFFSILLLISGLLSFLLVALIKNYLGFYLLDIPNERSSHQQPTPRGGGLGFIFAFAVTSAIASIFNPETYSSHPGILQTWLVLLPLTLIGILDDREGVSARVRCLVQFGVASIAVFCFGAFPQPWFTHLGMVGAGLAVLFTLVGMVALINFYNFIDGLDGLVAGVSIVQLSFLAIELNQPILLLLVAALLGFLWWNWSPAQIFMGDAGSTVLGATVSIALLNSGNHPSQSWSLLALTLPITADAIYTLVRRLLHHENIFKPHRTHFYQRLQQASWSHAQVATGYSLMTLFIAINIHFWNVIGACISLLAIISMIVSGDIYLSSETQLNSLKVDKDSVEAEAQNYGKM